MLLYLHGLVRRGGVSRSNPSANYSEEVRLEEVDELLDQVGAGFA